MYDSIQFGSDVVQWIRGGSRPPLSRHVMTRSCAQRRNARPVRKRTAEPSGMTFLARPEGMIRADKEMIFM